MAIHNPESYAIESNHFTYDPEKKWFIGEASSLRHLRPVQIYDDACDVGIAIRGKRHTIWFYQSEEKKDKEGDIFVWIFKPISEHVRKYPWIKDIEVHLLND